MYFQFRIEEPFPLGMGWKQSEVGSLLCNVLDGEEDGLWQVQEQPHHCPVEYTNRMVRSRGKSGNLDKNKTLEIYPSH